MTSDMPTLLPGKRQNSLITAGSIVEGELAALAVDNGYGVQVAESAEVTPLSVYRGIKPSQQGQMQKKVSGPRSSAGAEAQQPAAAQDPDTQKADEPASPAKPKRGKKTAAAETAAAEDDEIFEQ